MNSTATEPCVTRVNDLGFTAFDNLVARYGVTLEPVVGGTSIPGSYWGDPEAGLIGRSVYARADTPVHSVLHELSHLVCMSEERRHSLHRDAGGDDLEEAAVCYLQVLLADYVDGYAAAKIFADMDAWGYSFRLGSTRRWFAEDAIDAKSWLVGARLVSDSLQPAFRLRRD